LLNNIGNKNEKARKEYIQKYGHKYYELIIINKIDDLIKQCDNISKDKLTFNELDTYIKQILQADINNDMNNTEELIHQNIQYVEFLNDVCKIGGKEFNFK